MSEIKALEKLREKLRDTFSKDSVSLLEDGHTLMCCADEIEVEIAEAREITRKKHQAERVYWHNELHKILDAIDGRERFWGDCMDYPLPEATVSPSEIAKRMLSERYMLQPVDADGVRIDLGDKLIEHEDGHEFIVDGVKIWGSTYEWWAYEDGGVQAPAMRCTHVMPRTVEDILCELEGLRGNGAMYEDVVTRAAVLAHELRELLGGDAE